LAPQISRLLGWVWHWFVDGAALYHADLYASPDAPRHPWNEIEERKGPPRR